MGSYLRKLKILKPSLKCPVSFNLPPSIFLLEFLQKYDLEGQDVTVLTKAKMLVSLVQDWEKVSPVLVWRNVAHPTLQNKQKDLSWMAAHEILPVRAVMHSRGMAKNPICPWPGCGRPETVRHVFWECSVAGDL